MKGGALLLAAKAVSSSATKRARASALKPAAAQSSPAKKKQSTKELQQPPVTSSLCKLSPALAEVLKVPETTWPNVVKLAWDYIKAHKLQNAANKVEIVCDEKLKAVFNRDKLTTVELMKCLSPHVSKH